MLIEVLSSKQKHEENVVREQLSIEYMATVGISKVNSLLCFEKPIEILVTIHILLKL